MEQEKPFTITGILGHLETFLILKKWPCVSRANTTILYHDLIKINKELM